MKKTIYSLLSISVLAGAVSCQVDDVSEPTLTMMTEKTTYKVGEIVRFNFSGDADFVTFYSGVDNYNGGSVVGNIAASRYIYKDRASEPGQAILSFNCKKNAANPQDNAELKLFLSTNFTSDMTMDAIHEADWLDITDRAKWPTADTKQGTNVASGNIDLSQWNGQQIHIGLRYKAGTNGTQTGWTISSFNLKNTVPTDALPYTLWQNASSAKFGTMSDQLQEDGISPLYAWTLGTSLVCKGGDGSKEVESWAISSPINPSQVTPDYGTIIKGYSEVVPAFYDYQYWKPGKFTATVVARNQTAWGEKEVVQNIEIEIVEDAENTGN